MPSAAVIVGEMSEPTVIVVPATPVIVSISGLLVVECLVVIVKLSVGACVYSGFLIPDIS